MPEQGYLLLPFHPSWKVEYENGEAVFWPREALAYATLAMETGHPARRPRG